MKSVWKWIWVAIVIVFFIGGVGLLYQFAGLGYYLKALRVIYQAPTVQIKQETWNQFKGPDPKWVYGGILAGSWFDKIWVWGSQGLRVFTVDQYSIYSWFDGCDPEIMARLDAGASGAIIHRDIDTDINVWRGKARVGDYVRANLTPPGFSGVVGNLRELYDYNFWLFVQSGMEARCAK